MQQISVRRVVLILTSIFTLVSAAALFYLARLSNPPNYFREAAEIKIQKDRGSEWRFREEVRHFQACTKNSDCIKKSVLCSSISINKDFQSAYEKADEKFQGELQTAQACFAIVPYLCREKAPVACMKGRCLACNDRNGRATYE